MPKYEELMENYEDALFALLVEKCMEREGERYLALNQEWKKNAAGTVPPGAYERGMRTIDRTFRKQRCQTAGRVTAKIFTRIAVAICCMVLLFATAFAVSPAVREQVYALVKEVTEVSTDFSLVANPDSCSQPNAVNESSASIYGYSEPVVPEGFIQVDKIETEDSVLWLYVAECGGNIQIKITAAGESMSHSVDTEGASVVVPTEVGGLEGLHVIKDNISAFYMADTTNGLFISIMGEDVDVEVLIMIAEQMKYIG